MLNNIPAPASLLLLKSGLEVVFRKLVESFYDSLDNGVKTATFKQHFHIGEEMKACGCWIWWLDGEQKWCYVALGEKPIREESSVIGCIIAVKKLLLYSLIRSFSPTDLPRILQNVVDFLRRFFRTSWWIFSIFRGVALLAGLPDHSFSSRNVHPLLKRRYHMKYCVRRPIASSQGVCRSLPNVFAADYISLTQHFRQVFCSNFLCI